MDPEIWVIYSQKHLREVKIFDPTIYKFFQNSLNLISPHKALT